MKSTGLDFAKLFQTMPTPFMVLDGKMRFVIANDAYLAVTGRQLHDIVGRYVFDVFPDTPERQAATEASFRQALAGECNRMERNVYAIDRPGRGREDVYWSVMHTPMHDADGEVCGVLQYAQDVTAEVVAERMRDVISQEYDHRVRNLMTKISAIARHTARHSNDIIDFLNDFDPRISAMARTHELLVNGGWEQLGLRALIDSELGPFGSQQQIVIHGPDCVLSSRVAQALGMALHELATNAAKYGALSQADGRLNVNWRLDDDGGLTLDWLETGLSHVKTSKAAGFGTTIIDRILPLETGGTVARNLDATGLTCTITLPDPLKP
jgi:PAS domain S-box-containing protein